MHMAAGMGDCVCDGDGDGDGDGDATYADGVMFELSVAAVAAVVKV